MRRVFELEWSDELGEAWMNEGILSACLLTENHCRDGTVSVVDSAEGDALLRVNELLSLVGALWKLLDDIDTATDMAKNDDEGYRKAVEKIQAKRYDTGVGTDGYAVFAGGWPEGRNPQAEWLENFDPASQVEIRDEPCPRQGPPDLQTEAAPSGSPCMTTIEAPLGTPCHECVAPSKLLVYDAARRIAIWVCGEHAAGFDVVTYDRGTIPVLDGIEPS